MESTDTRKRPKPVDFDQLYPGRFLKAGELLGKKVTLTITDVDLDDLIGEDGKPKAKATVAFKETEKQLVLCKTNGICLKHMFGKTLADWTGKRVTLFPDTWNGEPCIRIWGSPDIERETDVQISLPRRRPFNKTMHKVAARGSASSPAAAPTVADALARLRGKDSLEAFEQERSSLWKLYAAAGVAVPLDVEATANEIRESLADADAVAL